VLLNDAGPVETGLPAHRRIDGITESIIESISARRSLKALGGFTLVELLIVIAIIGVLASLCLVAVTTAKKRVRESRTKSEIAELTTAIENYKDDEGTFPDLGKAPEEARNDFPFLYNALVGVPRADGGPGGLRSPYLKLEEDRIVVVNEDMSSDEGDEYRKATRKERDDPKIPKYYLDQFGNPYVYRKNSSWPERPFMHHPKGFDLYSLGPNGTDETILGEDEDSEDTGEERDDIGNW
jgi:prepilin-type N-terminal cleavage/methylation domain-containing protein